MNNNSSIDFNTNATSKFKIENLIGSQCDYCGELTYFLIDFKKSYFTHCPKCGRKIYHVICEHCQSGFAFTDKSRSFKLNENWWKCEVCGKKNFFSLNDFSYTKGYLKNELPDEIKNQLKNLWDYWWFKVIFIISLIGLSLLQIFLRLQKFK